MFHKKYRKKIFEQIVTVAYLKKQPPEVYCRKRSSYKFRKFHRKTPVLESFFNQVAGLRAFIFLKKKFQPSFFLVKFAKFFRTPTFKNIGERLLLYLHVSFYTMYEKDLHEKIKLAMRVRTLLNIYDEFFSKTVNDLLFPQKRSIIDI